MRTSTPQTTIPSPEPAPSSWVAIGKACLALALAALLFNITTHQELEGHLQTYSFVRKTITKVLNSGTAWAAIAFYAGWKAARPWASFVAGIAASLATLFIHYALGTLLHIYPPDAMSTNWIWFAAALVLCGPIGVAGWLGTRRGLLAVLARLVVPVGALVEPFLLSHFSDIWPQRPWPERYSDAASGVLLVVLGAVGVARVLWRSSRTPRPTATQPQQTC